MDVLFASPKLMYKALLRGKKHTSTAFLHWTHTQDCCYHRHITG